MKLFVETPTEEQVQKALEEIGPSRMRKIADHFNIQYETGANTKYSTLVRVVSRFPSDQAKPRSPRIYRARKTLYGVVREPVETEPSLSLKSVEKKKFKLEARKRDIKDELIKIEVQLDLLNAIIQQVLNGE